MRPTQNACETPRDHARVGYAPYNQTKPADIDDLDALVMASHVVDSYLALKGATHRALRDRSVEVLAYAIKLHGVDEGARNVETIVMEQGRFIVSQACERNAA